VGGTAVVILSEASTGTTLAAGRAVIA
jgi:hypothetical protein